MANAAIEGKFKQVVSGIGQKLKADGFAKSGNTFRCVQDRNAAVVEFQRSQSSTVDVIRFTINVGVVSGRLLAEWQPIVSKAGAADAHFRQRIGSLLAVADDKWWTMDAASDPNSIIAEVEPLIPPAVALLKSRILDTDLVALWETGVSPGLTEGQRQRYLSELQAAALPS